MEVTVIHAQHALSGTPFHSVGRLPCLSFRDIEKSHRILEEFLDYNAPYYGVSAAQISRQPYYSLLLFVEALVYQADLEIEAAQKGFIPFHDSKPWLDRHELLLALLRELQLDLPGAVQESRNLADYWHLENQLMYAGTLSDDLVVQALNLRSSDLMLLHHLLHHFLAMPPDPAAFAALLAWEVLLEVEWDLAEYADEVASNDYNTYRMFVKLHRDAAPARMQSELRRRDAAFEARVAALAPELGAKFRTLLPRLHETRPRPPIPAPIHEGAT